MHMRECALAFQSIVYKISGVYISGKLSEHKSSQCNRKECIYDIGTQYLNSSNDVKLNDFIFS